MACFGEFRAMFFVRALTGKVLKFPLRGGLVVIGVRLGSSEHPVRVMGVVSYLLHCNASNLVLEFWKMTKFMGQFALTSPLQIIGDSSPVIYAHVSIGNYAGFIIDVKTFFTFSILVTFLRFITFFILSTFFILKKRWQNRRVSKRKNGNDIMQSRWILCTLISAGRLHNCTYGSVEFSGLQILMYCIQ